MENKKSTDKSNETWDITQVINMIADEIDTDLDTSRKEKYFQDILLLYSFIEYILKWISFIKVLWDKAKKGFSKKEFSELRRYFRSITFQQCINIALAIKLIDFKLYEPLQKIRDERNRIVHRLWLYEHRNNKKVLRKKLEKLARLTSQLIKIFNKLTSHIGVDETYTIYL